MLTTHHTHSGRHQPAQSRPAPPAPRRHASALLQHQRLHHLPRARRGRPSRQLPGLRPAPHVRAERVQTLTPRSALIALGAGGVRAAVRACGRDRCPQPLPASRSSVATPMAASARLRAGRRSPSASSARPRRRASSTTCPATAGRSGSRTMPTPATWPWPTTCFAMPARLRPGSRPTRRSAGCATGSRRCIEGAARSSPAAAVRLGRELEALADAHDDAVRPARVPCPDTAPAAPRLDREHLRGRLSAALGRGVPTRP